MHDDEGTAFHRELSIQGPARHACGSAAAGRSTVEPPTTPYPAISLLAQGPETEVRPESTSVNKAQSANCSFRPWLLRNRAIAQPRATV